MNHANQFEQFADTEKNMNKLLESFTPVPRIFNCVLKNYVGNQFLFWATQSEMETDIELLFSFTVCIS